MHHSGLSRRSFYYVYATPLKRGENTCSGAYSDIIWLQELVVEEIGERLFIEQKLRGVVGWVEEEVDLLDSQDLQELFHRQTGTVQYGS